MEDNKMIHLFIINECIHKCPLCCNNQYSVDGIPVVTVDELKYAEMILLTGGEPFLYSGIDEFAGRLKQQYPNIRHVYVYTSGTSLYEYFVENGGTLDNIDGINISPKTKEEAKTVIKLFDDVDFCKRSKMFDSNRVYLFPNVRFLTDVLDFKEYGYEVFMREWQKEFVAKSGIFRRIPILFSK